MFRFYQHSLTIYTVFSQPKCNPRHLDKKSLLTRTYFWAGVNDAHPLCFLSMTWNNNKVDRTQRWVGLGSILLQEPKHEREHLLLTSSPTMTQQLPPWDQREEQTGVPDPDTGAETVCLALILQDKKKDFSKLVWVI